MAQNLEEDNFGISRMLRVGAITAQDVAAITPEKQELYKDGLALLDAASRGVGIPMMECIAKKELTLEDALELASKQGFGILTRKVAENGFPGHGSFIAEVRKDPSLLTKLSKLSEQTLLDVAQQIDGDRRLNENFYDIGEKGRARLRSIINDAPEQPGGQGNTVVPPSPTTPQPSTQQPTSMPDEAKREFQTSFASRLTRLRTDAPLGEIIQQYDAAVEKAAALVPGRSADIRQQLNGEMGIALAEQQMQNKGFSEQTQQALRYNKTPKLGRTQPQQLDQSPNLPSPSSSPYEAQQRAQENKRDDTERGR